MQPSSSITNPLCPKHSQRKQQLIHVCLQPSCKAQPLLCLKCISQNIHGEHSTEPLLEFAGKIDNMRFDEGIMKRATYLEGVIMKVRREVEGRLGEIQKDAEKFFGVFLDVHKSMVMQYQGLPLKPFQMNHKTFEALVQDISQKRRLFVQKKAFESQLNENFSKIQVDIRNQKRKLDMKIMRINMEMQRVRKKLSCSLNKQRKYGICPVPLTDTVLPIWSKKSQGPDLLSTSSGKLTRTNNTTTNLPVCSMSTPFLKNPALFSLKIVQLKRNLCFGICQPKQFIKWQLNKIGHGHYCIDAQGTVYSHIDAEVNGKLKGFKFGAGDTIQVEYGKGKVVFRKGVEASWEMKVEGMAGGGERVVVYLEDVGDSVELVMK